MGLTSGFRNDVWGPARLPDGSSWIHNGKNDNDKMPILNASMVIDALPVLYRIPGAEEREFTGASAAMALFKTISHLMEANSFQTPRVRTAIFCFDVSSCVPNEKGMTQAARNTSREPYANPDTIEIGELGMRFGPRLYGVADAASKTERKASEKVSKRAASQRQFAAMDVDTSVYMERDTGVSHTQAMGAFRFDCDTGALDAPVADAMNTLAAMRTSSADTLEHFGGTASYARSLSDVRQNTGLVVRSGEWQPFNLIKLLCTRSLRDEFVRCIATVWKNRVRTRLRAGQRVVLDFCDTVIVITHSGWFECKQASKERLEKFSAGESDIAITLWVHRLLKWFPDEQILVRSIDTDVQLLLQVHFGKRAKQARDERKRKGRPGQLFLHYWEGLWTDIGDFHEAVTTSINTSAMRPPPDTTYGLDKLRHLIACVMWGTDFVERSSALSPLCKIRWTTLATIIKGLPRKTLVNMTRIKTITGVVSAMRAKRTKTARAACLRLLHNFVFGRQAGVLCLRDAEMYNSMTDPQKNAVDYLISIREKGEATGQKELSTMVDTNALGSSNPLMFLYAYSVRFNLCYWMNLKQRRYRNRAAWREDTIKRRDIFDEPALPVLDEPRVQWREKSNRQQRQESVAMDWDDAWSDPSFVAAVMQRSDEAEQKDNVPFVVE